MPTPKLGASELLWLADRNMLEFARAEALWDPAGEVQVAGGLQLAASGTRFPAGAFNSAQALEAPEDPAQARAWLERARSFFAARGRGFTVYAREDRDAALAAACVERKMQPMHGSPGMVLDARVPEAPLPAGTRIERIGDAAGLADFVRVATPAYQMMSLPPGVAAAVFADARRVLTPDLAAYVAYVDDAAAATVLCLASHGIAGLYWVATHPDLQRRGLADAITRRASNAAFEAGAGCVILQATRFGEPVYRRIGFREIARYAWYFVTRAQIES